MTLLPKTTLRAFALPLFATLLALIPGCNYFAYGHEGFGIILVYASLPWFVTMFVIASKQVDYGQKKRFWLFALAALIAYVPITFLLSMAYMHGVISTHIFGNLPFWPSVIECWQVFLFFPFLYTLATMPHPS